MSRSYKFWDRIAARYSKQPVADEASYQKKLQVTRDYFRPEMNVLELGCGTGSTAIAHSPFVQHITAIDVSSRMLEIAQRKADAEGVSNVSFEQSTVDAFAGEPASYDAVLALSILHLLDDRDEVIAKIHTLLKPGGLFVSSTACLGKNMRFLEYVAPVGAFLGLLPLLRVFTPDELADSIARAGFSIDYQWQPDIGKAVFIVAKKAE
jgi:ubiquinone/menaquinone biosynthesis C-methylase UbiE